ncbi:MAG: hypothetical protein OWQ54_02115 [Sulfolobaceae archaeon]|nr:hypothetical protein [Sulfolobaceae archaeon]
MALIRNYISTLIQGNKEPPTHDIKEKLCQLNEETLMETIDDVATFILNIRLDEEKKKELIDFIKRNICSPI